MANQLKMATIDTIRTLREQGWSLRRIARTLGIHRDTVARHLERAKLGRAPTGSEEVKLGQAPIGSEALPAARSRTSQPSLCAPFRAEIQSKLDQGLTAQRIFQDLVAEHGFGGKYHSVRRYVRRLAPKQDLPFRRLECGPGEEAQVDFGRGAANRRPSPTCLDSSY